MRHENEKYGMKVREKCMERRETGETINEKRKSRVGGQDIGEKF